MTPWRRCHDTTYMYISQNMADRVYMYIKSIYTYMYMYMYVYMCTYIVHDCTYSAKLLRIAVYICRVESLGQRVYGAGVRELSFTRGIMWHVARRTAVATRVLSLRCEYASL